MTREEALQRIVDNNYAGDYGFDLQILIECMGYSREIILDSQFQNKVLYQIRSEIEQLPTKTRINWDGCCPDIDYPEIEYVDVSKNKLLSIIDKYKTGSEEKNG